MLFLSLANISQHMNEILGLQPRAVFLLIFAALVGIVLFIDRKKVNRHFIFFYRRTRRGIRYIDQIARAAPQLWRAYGWGSFGLSFLSIVGSLGVIIYTFYTMFQTQSLSQGPSLVLPGTGAEPEFQAGISFIPAEYWVIGIAVLMFVHEMSHGIVARAEGIEVSSVGWFVMGIIPGAFVEPKGEKMMPGGEDLKSVVPGIKVDDASWKSKIKVFGAGSLANYITGAAFVLLATGLVGAVSTNSEVYYNAQDGLPAAQAGMDNGTLKQINNVTINDVTDLQRASDQLEINQTVDVWTSEGNFTMIAGENPDGDGGYIGILVGQRQILKEQYEPNRGFLLWFVTLLNMVGLLNILIGIFNMLPAKPLDGGLIVETLIQEFSDEKNVKYLDQFSTLIWIVMLGTVVVAIAFGGGGV